jgi:hypothetical protein
MITNPKRMLFLALLSTGIHFVPAQTQPVVNLPKPDSDGWIKLFRGNNPDDWFVCNNGKSPAEGAVKFPNATFSILKGDTIKSLGSPTGQVYFKQPFSHYHIRYQMHFPGNQGNCGMLLHVQENDPVTASYGFPVSMESQGDPGQGMGQLWPIGDVWVTLRASKGTNSPWRYDPGGKDTVYGGKDWGSRVIEGKDGWGKPSYSALSKATGWVTQEVDVHGSDSIAHIVADTVRIKYRNPRVSHGGTPNNVSKKLASGLLGWQSEGTEVWYRNIEIKLYPEDPLYKSLYATTAARDYRILPRTRAKPSLRFEQGALQVLEGDKGIRTVSGRAFPLP